VKSQLVCIINIKENISIDSKILLLFFRIIGNERKSLAGKVCQTKSKVKLITKVLKID